MLAAVALALCLHPAAVGMREVLHRLYPISPETKQQLTVFADMIHGVPLWQIVLLLAVTPAICEELAFRGFILSGLRHIGQKGTAILVSSVFFGIVHGVLQQSLNAFMLGMILGYVAVHTGSILPCVLFHGVHNAMQLCMASALTTDFLSRNPQMARFLTDSTEIEGALVYRTPILMISILASGVVLCWFRSLPHSLSAEEQLQDALDHQSPAAGSLG
jgi:sodium transport system permease protein